MLAYKYAVHDPVAWKPHEVSCSAIVAVIQVCNIVAPKCANNIAKSL